MKPENMTSNQVSTVFKDGFEDLPFVVEREAGPGIEP
jgi:hypothetical protein